MSVKSIIVSLSKAVKNKDHGEKSWIQGTTSEGNNIVFWGNHLSCVNVRAIENQEPPFLVVCRDCKKNYICRECGIDGEYYSIDAAAIITILPYSKTDLRQALSSQEKVRKINTTVPKLS